MTENVKKMAPEILAEIKKAKRILLHCHPSPDADSVGGVLAMASVLKSLGKTVTIIKGDSKLPAHLSTLPGFAQIIEKNLFEIDLSQFDLFIMQDSAAPKMVSALDEIVFPKNLNTIIIDHHNSNQKFAKINLVDINYPANCQLLYDLFTLWQVPITPDIALCLFAGIFTDTGGFKYRGVSKETFAVAARLVEIVPNFSELISAIENSNDPKQIEYEALVLSSTETYFGGKVAIAAVPFSVLAQKNIGQDFTRGEHVVGRLLSVVDWDIIVSMTEEVENGVKMSFRSKNADIYDVSKIAALIGGGGHKAASGAYLKMSLAQAKQKVLVAIGRMYPKLGII